MSYYQLPLERGKNTAISIYSHRLLLLFISILAQILLLGSVWLVISQPTLFFLLFIVLWLIWYRLKHQRLRSRGRWHILVQKAAWISRTLDSQPVDPTFVERSKKLISNTSRNILDQWGSDVSSINTKLELFFQKVQEFGGTISLASYRDVALGIGSESSEVARIITATFETTRVIESRYSATQVRSLNEQGLWKFEVQETAKKIGGTYAQMSLEERDRFAKDYTELSTRDLQLLIELREKMVNQTHIYGNVNTAHTGSGDLDLTQSMLEPTVRESMTSQEVKSDLLGQGQFYVVQAVSIMLNTLFLGIWMLFQWGVIALGQQLRFDGIDLLIFNTFQVVSGFATLIFVVINYYVDIRMMWLRQKARILQAGKNDAK